MTKKQLLETIKNVPDDMDIFIKQNNTDFNLSMLESAEVKEATFTEGMEGGEEAQDNVLILSDEQ